MDLRNNLITVGEILNNPKAKAILTREFPELMNPLLIGMARRMTLSDVLLKAHGRYPKEKLDRVLSELRAV
jgi:hypothetical protein